MSVSVGFSPATTALVTAQGSDGASVDAGTASAPGGDLFAQLLALLGNSLPEAAPDAGAGPLGDAAMEFLTSLAGTDSQLQPAFSVPPATLPGTAVPDADDIAKSAAELSGPGGKSLLKNLADALTALNDALSAGEIPDARQLATVDELASALAGLLSQAQSGLAAAAPQSPVAADGASISPADAATNAPDLAAALREAIAGLAPRPPTPRRPPESHTPGSADAPESADAPTASDTSGTAAAPAVAEMESEAALDPAIAELGKIFDALADKLRDKAPALADKLATLGAEVKNPALTSDALEKLGLAADATGEIAELANRIATPQPAPVATGTKPDAPFTPPALPLPTSEDDKTAPAAVSQPQTTSTVDASPAQAAGSDNGDIEIDPRPRGEIPTPADPTARTKSEHDAPRAADATPASQAQQPLAPPAVARTAQGAYQAQSLVPSLPQVAYEFVRHVEGGSKRFQIRLDPPELGRIDVRLSVDSSGAVQARMTVERAETLDMMQRDQRSLQQALQQAGLDMSKTSLEFSLNQNAFGRGQPGQGGQSGSPWGDGSQRLPESAASSDGPLSPLEIYRGTATQRGLNLFV